MKHDLWNRGDTYMLIGVIIVGLLISNKYYIDSWVTMMTELGVIG